MTATLPLHVCEGCGQINEAAADRIRVLEEQVAILQEDVENLDRDHRRDLAQIRRLKADHDARLRGDEHFTAACDVLDHWQAVCSPTAREPYSPKRLEAVLARLHGGYPPATLKRACDGYALKPYVVNGHRTHDGPKDSWQADAELIFRDAKHVDQGLRISDRADDLRQVLAGQNDEPSAAPVAVGGFGIGTLSALGTAALKAAQHGFAVFPCRQADKVPATPNGFKAATRDPEKITLCWSRHPYLNVGAATGQTSGIVVLDVDGDEGWDSLMELQDEHQELPDTLSVQTPRGGHHFYFQWPGVEVRNTVGFPKPYLDVRGDGGYVLIPPSVNGDGRKYEVDEAHAIAPMPQWLVDLLLDQQRKQAQVTGGRDWAAFVAAGANQGERDNRMTSFVGWAFNQTTDSNVVLEMAKIVNRNTTPPLTDRDLKRIVTSIERIRAREAA